ncbi:hypothetical protein K2Q08_03190, partial [Patescibacteria group bacterium]|nr:hypothetical protein [Patescibacteria group bacterium]
DVWVRRWALYLTLFVAGAAIAIDLTVLLTSFLNGESMTVAFLLKVLVVLLVAAIGFMHFLADLRGYWAANPKFSRYVTAGVAVLGILTVAAGFLILGTPQQARLMRLDENKITDLQNIQYQIVSYWQAKQALPQSLTDLNDSISGFSAPNDPQSNQPYEYKVNGPHSFSLCANFNGVSQGNGSEQSYAKPYGVLQDNWAHTGGYICFERTIDPARYPANKPTPVQ